MEPFPRELTHPIDILQPFRAGPPSPDQPGGGAAGNGEPEWAKPGWACAVLDPVTFHPEPWAAPPNAGGLLRPEVSL